MIEFFVRWLAHSFECDLDPRVTQPTPPFSGHSDFLFKIPPPSLSLPSLSVCLATVWSYRRKLVFFSILFPVYFRKFTLWHHQKLTHKRTNRHRGTGFNVPWQRRVFFLTTQTYGGQRLEQQQQLLAMIIIIIIILTIPPPLFFLLCRNVYCDCHYFIFLPISSTHPPTPGRL